MAPDASHAAVMARRNEILKQATGIDYDEFVLSPIAFDYEGLLGKAGFDIRQVQRIQAEAGVGGTRLVELPNLTRLVRKVSPGGKGARIFIKDEAGNPSRSFKDRRASLNAYKARERGYDGISSASSGNYGAAVASQAAKRNLKCIIVQEVFDSRGVGQPEILEKGRACEAYGAEVLQVTVGPELFYLFLRTLEETGFYSASLYTPDSIAGIETLGYEIGEECRKRFGKAPEAVVITSAGGGNLTGTARGLLKAGCPETQIIGASVDIHGLHMASDRDFNRKSFTTGHTGFSMPFITWPDRSDVPLNACRTLRYMDRFVTISQGEVFYVCEALARLEGLEKGPAGNTSLAAAVALAREMPDDALLVVQETEYTGAGKHHFAQLTFARQMGIEIRRGDPRENVPGRNIVIPEHPSQFHVNEADLDRLRASYLKRAREKVRRAFNDVEIRFLAEDTKTSANYVRQAEERLAAAGKG